MDVDFVPYRDTSPLPKGMEESGERKLSSEAPLSNSLYSSTSRRTKRNSDERVDSRSKSSDSIEADLLQEKVLLETEQISFTTYIPNSATNVRFDFCLEENGKELR